MGMMSAEGERAAAMHAEMERFIWDNYENYGTPLSLRDQIADAINHLRFCLVGHHKPPCCVQARALLSKYSKTGEPIIYPKGGWKS